MRAAHIDLAALIEQGRALSAVSRPVIARLEGRKGRVEVKITFAKASLTFARDDSPMAILLLSVMGGFAEFERVLIQERQREGIALARARGAHRGRNPAITADQARQLRLRATAGEPISALAREYSISRQTVCEYLRRGESRCRACRVLSDSLGDDVALG